MSNKHPDPLFQLVTSLSKAEKKNFKLYVQRNSARQELRTVALFDQLEKMSEYDDALLLKKLQLPKQQLLNIKARLYKELLSSLRLLKDEKNIDMQLREQLDFARILYNKGLYAQSLRLLDHLKPLATEFHQYSFLQQVLFFEKKIESLHITRSFQNRAEMLASAAEDVRLQLNATSKLTNLSLLLYSWYIRNGHARGEKDAMELKALFDQVREEEAKQPTGFYEQLYLYQCYCWYAFIHQDYLLHYRYAKKWTGLFESESKMIEVECGHYIKGLHNLLESHFHLKNFQKFPETIAKLESLTAAAFVAGNENDRVQSLIYLYTARVNFAFTEGRFTEGLNIVPEIEELITERHELLDSHRVLVFYYKIACLYFGSGDSDRCLDYLNRIINWKTDLRIDLQCYARLLQLIAHYELGNFGLLEYLSRSVYRLMGKMEHLSVVEEEIFSFLKLSMKLPASKLEKEFSKLHQRLQVHSNDKYAARAYSYLDIVSWLESKMQRKPVQEIIRNKFLQMQQP